MSSNKSLQIALSKFYKKSSITDLRWSIVYKVRQNVPNKPDNYSICNLEHMAIAELNKDRS